MNKHFHVYSGWFAYLAGLAQCYRGLESVAPSDELVFSAANLDFSVSYSLLAQLSVHVPVRACVGVFFILLEQVAIECSRQ